jgi:hypothetical protein
MVTEEEFNRQEQQRLEAERRKEALLKGTPMPGSVEEFLVLFRSKLNENPLLEEYISREHADAKASLTRIEEFYERKLKEHQDIVQEQNSVLDSLFSKLQELQDNFNLFAQQSLELQKSRFDRVNKSLDILDRVILQEC